MSRKKKKPVPVEVVQVKNPAALQMEDVVGLFRRAFDKHPWVDGKQIIDVLLFNDLEQDVGCFLARRGIEGWVGLAIIMAPEGNLFPYPMVYWLYGGGAASRDALCRACVQWAQEHGFQTVITANYRMDRSRAFVKVFGRLVRQAKVVGQVVAFDVR